MSDKGEIILYQDDEGEEKIEVRLEGETVWLTETEMASLFKTHRTSINRHLRNIFKSGELDEKNTVKKVCIPHSDKPVSTYNLDMVISIGYRVNARMGIKFRIWATQRIKQALLDEYHHLTMNFLEKIFSRQLPTYSSIGWGYIYLLKAPSGYYKIGRTKNPVNRLYTFHSKLPFEVEYVWLHPTNNMIKLENQLHQHFVDKRVNGEWFALDETDVQTFIEWQDDSIIG